MSQEQEALSSEIVRWHRDFVEWFRDNELPMDDRVGRLFDRMHAIEQRSVLASPPEGGVVPVGGAALRCRKMADEVLAALEHGGHGWDDEQVQQVQTKLLPDAYDLLNLLSIALTSPAAASEAVAWVSVGDRLPKPMTMVIAAHQDVTGAWWKKAASYEPENDDAGLCNGWRIFGGYWPPSHWREMPADPAPLSGASHV